MSSWRERQAKKNEIASQKKVEINEINFPSLTVNAWEPPKTGAKKHSYKSFASLAKEWNEQTEQEKIQMDAEEQRLRIEEFERQEIRKRRGAYNFGTSHAREEDTYYETMDDEYIPESDDVPHSDDWQTVSKKVKKQRSTFDSIAFQEPTAPQEHETAWDDYE